MKGLAVIITVLMVSFAPAAADSPSSSADFSLVSYNGVTFSGSSQSVGVRFQRVQLGWKVETGLDGMDGSVEGTRREFEMAHMYLAGQYPPVSLSKPPSTRSRGYALLGTGMAMVAGGYVLRAATKNSANYEIAWAGALGSWVLIGAGTLAIYKGLGILIFSSPNEYEMSCRLGIDPRGGFQTALKVSF